MKSGLVRNVKARSCPSRQLAGGGLGGGRCGA